MNLNGAGEAREIAWGEFYALYSPVIVRFARSFGVRGSDADEIVADVLGNFFQASPNFVYDAGKGRFRGYLKTCTVRAIARNSQRRNRETAVDPISLDAEAPAVDDAWNKAWKRERLQRAIESVRKQFLSRPESVKTFRAFEMNVLLGQPAKSVADELGVEPNGVHVAKSRVSAAIRNELAKKDALLGEE